MKWTYTTEGNEFKEVPLDWDILVQLKSSNDYYVLNFRMDSDYGMVSALYESYVSPTDVRKFILITD